MSRRLFALLRSLIVSTLFISLWTWFVPRWIAGGPLEPQPGIASLSLMVIGGSVMAWCVFAFAWRGLGTPAPFDPPRRLVVSGLYRWVRNPMYLGMGIFLIGEALMLPGITRAILFLVTILWAVVTLFIVLYEEPTLRRLFGAEYENYCRHVHRWLPRLTPFDKETTAAVH
jgi:protein-S-isoprenylcysteine O-methyltransferase Ste14